MVCKCQVSFIDTQMGLIWGDSTGETKSPLYRCLAAELLRNGYTLLYWTFFWREKHFRGVLFIAGLS